LLAGQVLLHTVLTFTAAHEIGVEHGSGSSLLPSTAMLIGHILAALLAALALAFGESISARWASALTHLLGTPALTLPATPTLPARTTPGEAPARPVLSSLRHHVARRGPPIACALFN
jgi:hypothetical protein